MFDMTRKIRSNSDLTEYEVGRARERAKSAGVKTGRLLGNGCTRLVFVDGSDPSQVVKVPRYTAEENEDEFKVWRRTEQRPDLRRWMVPCVAIKGGVLIQKRARPLTRKREFKLVIPNFFQDVEGFNISLYDGEIRIHDYAYVAWDRLENPLPKTYVFWYLNGKIEKRLSFVAAGYPEC